MNVFIYLVIYVCIQVCTVYMSVVQIWKKNLSDIPILNFLHHLITGAGSSDGLPDALTPERQERGKERGREWYLPQECPWSYCSHRRPAGPPPSEPGLSDEPLAGNGWARWNKRQGLDNDWCLSVLPDSLIKPINLYAEEVSNANGSNLAKQSGIVSALWRVPKLEVRGLAARFDAWKWHS